MEDQQKSHTSFVSSLMPGSRVTSVFLIIVGVLCSLYWWFTAFVVKCIDDFTDPHTLIGNYHRYVDITWPLSCLGLFLIPAIILWNGIRKPKANVKTFLVLLIYGICIAIASEYMPVLWTHSGRFWWLK